MRSAYHFLRGTRLACVMGVALMASPLAAAEFNDTQRAEIIQTVREYLLQNPELLQEMIAAMELKEQANLAAVAEKGIADNAKTLFRDEADFVAGNADGDVTVVEFFDYQCGYCKAVHADTLALVKGDPKLRLVLKEFPILGPASLLASKAALASRSQGKYMELHNALMSHRGQLDEAVIMRLAKSVGLDTDRLKKDMESPDVLTAIAANQSLAEKLNIRGTPAFVFGDELVPGAIKLDDMKRLTDAARSKG